MINEQKLRAAVESYRKHVKDTLIVTTWQAENEDQAFAGVLEALGASTAPLKITPPPPVTRPIE